MQLLIAVPLGFGLGFLLGLTGVGGGALMAPALYVILGLPYGEVVALSLIYSVFTKIFSAVQHVRQGTVRWKVTLLYGLAGIPGAMFGSRLVYLASDDARRIFPLVMGGALLVVAALLLMEAGVRASVPRDKPFSPEHIGWRAALVVVGLQLLIGVVLGLTSVGSGSLVVSSMLFLFRMPVKDIVGSNIVIGLMMVIPAGLTHYLVGGVEWRLLAFLLLGSLGGSILGSRATMVIPERGLKLTITALIVAAALATILKAW